MIADAQYTDEQYQTRIGWGHATVNTVVDLAAQAGVRQLALFHHDPLHSNRDLDAMVEAAGKRASRWGTETTVFGAREGVQLPVD